VPAGGFVLRPPCPGSIRAVTVTGRTVKKFAADEVRVRVFPATVRVAFETINSEELDQDG
jgi:hypothetical protein